MTFAEPTTAGELDLAVLTSMGHGAPTRRCVKKQGVVTDATWPLATWSTGDESAKTKLLSTHKMNTQPSAADLLTRESNHCTWLTVCHEARYRRCECNYCNCNKHASPSRVHTPVSRPGGPSIKTSLARHMQRARCTGCHDQHQSAAVHEALGLLA